MIKDSLRSLTSFIQLNLKFIFNFSQKKTLIFNFPREQVAKKDINYIQDLFKDLEKKYLVVYIHKIKNQNLNLKNKYYMHQYLLKFIFNVDFFVSNYISDFFPFKSKKIYIHHCITDSPLTDIKKNNEIAARFYCYNYILINSKFVKKYFNQILSEYCKKFKKKNTYQVIDVGYPRIDYLLKKINLKNKNKSIIIAPANFIAFKNFSLINDLEFIIDNLLKFFSLKVIFRPHPQNRKDILTENFKFNERFAFLNKYQNDKRFIFDTSDNYLKNYSESKLMISDLSGTAFTFAFLTNNPVLFFSNNEKKFQRLYNTFEHFKLRSKTGIDCNKKKLFLRNMNKLIKNKKNFSSLIKLEKKRLTQLSNAKKNIKNFFEKI